MRLGTSPWTLICSSLFGYCTWYHQFATSLFGRGFHSLIVQAIRASFSSQTFVLWRLGNLAFSKSKYLWWPHNPDLYYFVTCERNEVSSDSNYRKFANWSYSSPCIWDPRQCQATVAHFGFLGKRKYGWKRSWHFELHFMWWDLLQLSWIY